MTSVARISSTGDISGNSLQIGLSSIITKAGAISGTSLAISGSSAIPTPAMDNSSNTIATTAYVKIQGYAKYEVTNATYNLSGGGTVTWNAPTVTWTQRVIAINLNGSLASDGYFDIGPTSYTFVGGWTALYYIPTNGMGPGFDRTKLIDVGFPAPIGENWIFICSFNSDTSMLRWNPGYVIIPNGGSYNSTTGTLVNPTFSAITGSSLNVGSTGLVTCGNIKIGNTTIADPGGTLATQSYVTSQGFATQSYVNSQGFATQSYVTSRGYLTSGSGTNPTFGNVNLTGNLTATYLGTTRTISDFFGRLYDLGTLVSTTYAPKVSPAFSGTPTATNPDLADNGTRIATTNFVKSQNYFVSNYTAPYNYLNCNGISNFGVCYNSGGLFVYGTTSVVATSYTSISGINTGNTVTTKSSGLTLGIESSNVIKSAGFTINSDQRIKKNIQTLSPEESLHLIQNLKPVSFDYIDPTKRTTKKYGFIAQEVESVLPTVINHSSEYIPNIFELVQIDKTNKTRIRLTTKTTNLFELSKDKTQKIKLKFYDASNNEILREIQEILDDKTMILSKPIMEDPLFLYGQEVPDFRSIENEQINAVLLSAVQAQQTKIESLESKNVSLEKKIQDIESKIDFLLSKIT